MPIFDLKKRTLRMSRLDNQNVKLSAVFSFSVNRRTWQLAAPTDRTTLSFG